MTVTSIRPAVVVAAALASVAMAPAASHAASSSAHPAARSGTAAYVAGTRPDSGTDLRLRLIGVYDEQVTLTARGVHLGGAGWFGGTLLR